jgi:hypothetical protein
MIIKSNFKILNTKYEKQSIQTGLRNLLGRLADKNAVYSASAKKTLCDGTFLERNGCLVVEAENFNAQISGTDEFKDFSFRLVTDVAGYSGPGAVMAGPSTGAITWDETKGPRLDYTVYFKNPGTYYLWVRSFDGGCHDDSVHFGINGELLTSGGSGIGYSSTFSNGVLGQYGWEGKVLNTKKRVKFEITEPGRHIVNMWMREDGTIVDKFLITQDSSLVPAEGIGPNESPLIYDESKLKPRITELSSETSQVSVASLLEINRSSLILQHSFT